jgi:hypothetical protein
MRLLFGFLAVMLFGTEAQAQDPAIRGRAIAPAKLRGLPRHRQDQRKPEQERAAVPHIGTQLQSR